MRISGVVLLGLVPLLGVGAAQAQYRGPIHVPAAKPKPIPFPDARLKIEYNATDGDAGLQIFADAKAWRTISITNPQGKLLAELEAKQVIRNYGLTELFAESSEPPFTEFPFAKFKRLFPEGPYTFRGTAIDGKSMKSVFRLTHKVPAGQKIVAPREDATVSRDELTIRWKPVPVRGVKVVAYQVLVVADAPSLGNPTRVLDVMLPTNVTRFPVPAQFLVPGTYKTEVLAIEASGNQTLTEVAFKVR